MPVNPTGYGEFLDRDMNLGSLERFLPSSFFIAREIMLGLGKETCIRTS